MPKVAAFHSTKKGTDVYHNNSACTEGNNIEKEYRKEGTGGHRLCVHCQRLNRDEE
ncbi:MAG: hypothetical protein GX444_09860 [Myxococcales bacterium]|nr:hypothetical protein [Myxococcales bacterium]